MFQMQDIPAINHRPGDLIALLFNPPTLHEPEEKKPQSADTVATPDPEVSDYTQSKIDKLNWFREKAIFHLVAKKILSTVELANLIDENRTYALMSLNRFLDEGLVEKVPNKRHGFIWKLKNPALHCADEQ